MLLIGAGPFALGLVQEESISFPSGDISMEPGGIIIAAVNFPESAEQGPLDGTVDGLWWIAELDLTINFGREALSDTEGSLLVTTSIDGKAISQIDIDTPDDPTGQLEYSLLGGVNGLVLADVTTPEIRISDSNYLQVEAVAPDVLLTVTTEQIGSGIPFQAITLHSTSRLVQIDIPPAPLSIEVDLVTVHHDSSIGDIVTLAYTAKNLRSGQIRTVDFFVDIPDGFVFVNDPPSQIDFDGARQESGVVELVGPDVLDDSTTARAVLSLESDFNDPAAIVELSSAKREAVTPSNLPRQIGLASLLMGGVVVAFLVQRRSNRIGRAGPTD